MFPGIFISKIACGSAAAKEGNVYVGDRVVSVSFIPFFYIYFVFESSVKTPRSA